MKKSILCFALLLASTALAACGGSEETPKTYEGTTSYKLVVEGFEWGPASSKMIADFGGIVSGSLKKEDFVIKNGNSKRTVENIQFCDENGNPIDGSSSRYVLFSFKTGYSGGSFGSPIEGSTVFEYGFSSGRNTWKTDLATYSLTLASTATLTIDQVAYSTVSIAKSAYTGKITDADIFNVKGDYTSNSQTLTYAAYEPANYKTDSGKNPLIIWLHGAGEGGTDISIALLGNDVTNLAEDPIQGYFREDGLAGAYVFAAQSPTMWMDSGSGQHSGNQGSIYLETLKSLIDHYVTTLNTDVDTSRIYLGGCSNGGYQTMNLLINYPGYFAAGYPVCEAYSDSIITDDQINELKSTPIWFTTSADDTTVAPNNFTVPTYVRLVQAGATNVHFSYFENVIGVDALGTTYMGHWSWIYTLSDRVFLDQNQANILANGAAGIVVPSATQLEGITSMWSWMAAQSL